MNSTIRNRAVKLLNRSSHIERFDIRNMTKAERDKEINELRRRHDKCAPDFGIDPEYDYQFDKAFNNHIRDLIKSGKWTAKTTLEELDESDERNERYHNWWLEHGVQND
jgi:hypothetical protein